MQCPNCTAWLVEHRCPPRAALPPLRSRRADPGELPGTAAQRRAWSPVGPGVERVAEEAAALFPEARRLVMASDTLPGPRCRRRRGARDRGARGEIDILIGTQIVAKGHHFPQLTLVGVVDADLGLAGGDLRAAERTLQLLHQVAGRAGRAEAPGRVLLQTLRRPSTR